MKFSHLWRPVQISPDRVIYVNHTFGDSVDERAVTIKRLGHLKT